MSNFKLLLAINILLSLLKLCHCDDMLDPGKMFDERDLLTNPGGGVTETIQSFLYSASLRDDKPWFDDNDKVDSKSASTNACSMGTSTVLKRIIYKLYNHINLLQPSELDDEFIYSSTLSYTDYISMSKHLSEKQLTCANLHRLDTLISKFISKAEVTRPRNQNYFHNIFSSFTYGSQSSFYADSSFIRELQLSPILYLAIILSFALFVAYIMRSLFGVGQFMSYVVALALVGFMQYYIDHHSSTMNNYQARVQSCHNPSYLASILTPFYDYNDCNKLIKGLSDPNNNPATISNIAKILVQFGFDIISDPIVILASKFGKASQAYLNEYTGLLGYFQGPIFLVLIYIVILIIIIYVSKYLIQHIFSGSRGIKSNARNRQQNATTNKHRIASPKKKQIQYKPTSLKKLRP